MARVVIENLSKIFRSSKGDVNAVRDVNLIVEDQELLVLVGPSGAGKSTLLRLIAGLEEISGGAIYIDGLRMNDVPPKERDIAMVFQNYALYPHMTAYENMAFGLKLRKFSKSEIDKRVRESAEILGLNSVLDQLPNALSGGERQRVAVGRAIVRKPKVFLFDEPLSNLDAQRRVQMRRELSKLHHRLASTMIFVTHDQVEAMTMGDRVAVLKDGSIQQVEEPVALYERPVNMFVAGFIGSPAMNFFNGTLQQKPSGICFEGQVSREPGQPEGLTLRLDDLMARPLNGHIGKQIVLGVRPEDISMVELVQNSSVPAGNTRNHVEAEIEVIEPMGSETYLSLSTGVHSFVVRVRANYSAQPNQRISVAFNMNKAHFFDPVTHGAFTSCQ